MPKHWSCIQGHPLGLFPSHTEAPRVVVTNGMMIPNHSKPEDWEKYNALGVTQYGQMTAGFLYVYWPSGNCATARRSPSSMRVE